MASASSIRRLHWGSKAVERAEQAEPPVVPVPVPLPSGFVRARRDPTLRLGEPDSMTTITATDQAGRAFITSPPSGVALQLLHRRRASGRVHGAADELGPARIQI